MEFIGADKLFLFALTRRVSLYKLIFCFRVGNGHAESNLVLLKTGY